MKPYIELHCTKLKPSVQEIIISILDHLEYNGFEEPEPGTFKAYIQTNLFDEKVIKELAGQYGFRWKVTRLEPQNWNKVWEATFKPVTIGDEIYIRAPFHSPAPHHTHEILITPGQTFGTGHHESTYLMLQCMTGIRFKNRTVLDAGCGTGILSILADQKGAKAIFASDNNEWGYANAALNIRQNKAHRVKLLKEDILDDGFFQNKLQNRTFDVMLANLNKNLLHAFIPNAIPWLRKGGTFLAGGILKAGAKEVELKARNFQLKTVKIIEQTEWYVLQFVKE